MLLLTVVFIFVIQGRKNFLVCKFKEVDILADMSSCLGNAHF